ncbi:hypothetical protein Tco_0582367, partial [Tanacetum coccineum]
LPNLRAEELSTRMLMEHKDAQVWRDGAQSGYYGGSTVSVRRS